MEPPPEVPDAPPSEGGTYTISEASEEIAVIAEEPEESSPVKSPSLTEEKETPTNKVSSPPTSPSTETPTPQNKSSLERKYSPTNFKKDSRSVSPLDRSDSPQQGRGSPLQRKLSSSPQENSTSPTQGSVGRASPPRRKFTLVQGRSSPQGKSSSPQGGRSPSVGSSRNTPEGRESFGFPLDREYTPPRSYYSADFQVC